MSRWLPGKSDEDITEFVRNAQLRIPEVNNVNRHKINSLFGNIMEKTDEKKTNTAQQMMSRWVKKISDRIQLNPELDTIIGTETACRDLDAVYANELRAKLSGIVKRHDEASEQNVSKQELAIGY